MRDRKQNKKLPVVMILLVTCLLTACSGGRTRIVFTTGFGKEDVFRIEDITCTREELSVYLGSMQSRYEEVYGKDIWGRSYDGYSMEDNVRDNALSKITRVKVMYLLACDRDITLDEEEESRAKQAAGEYLRECSKVEGLTGTSEALLEQMYREYILSRKVYEDIIGDVNPEISDDEARTITVQSILLKISGGARNSEGTSYDGEQELHKKAEEIHTMAVSGEEDFLKLAGKYSDDPQTTYSFRKGEMQDKTFEEVAFRLATDEISEVFRTDQGFCILKCISTFDKEQTQLNKLQIVEDRQRETFGQVYDAFASSLARQMNMKVWDTISISDTEGILQPDFFEIYRRIVSDDAL